MCFVLESPRNERNTPCTLRRSSGTPRVRKILPGARGRFLLCFTSLLFCIASFFDIQTCFESPLFRMNLPGSCFIKQIVLFVLGIFQRNFRPLGQRQLLCRAEAISKLPTIAKTIPQQRATWKRSCSLGYSSRQKVRRPTVTFPCFDRKSRRVRVRHRRTASHFSSANIRCPSSPRNVFSKHCADRQGVRKSLNVTRALKGQWRHWSPETGASWDGPDQWPTWGSRYLLSTLWQFLLCVYSWMLNYANYDACLCLCVANEGFIPPIVHRISSDSSDRSSAHSWRQLLCITKMPPFTTLKRRSRAFN